MMEDDQYVIHLCFVLHGVIHHHSVRLDSVSWLSIRYFYEFLAAKDRYS